MQGSERRLLVIGALLLASAVAQLGLAWLARPQWAAGLGATMAAELVSGRETAIPFASSAGVPPLWIAVTSILQNLGLAAILVPFAEAGIGAAAKSTTFVGRIASRLVASATSQAKQGWGAGGIFLFMLVPFLANGPIIAGLIGILAGVERRRLAVAVTAAVIITAAAWSFAYAALASALAGINPALALVPAIVAAIVVAWTPARFAWTWCRRPELTLSETETAAVPLSSNEV